MFLSIRVKLPYLLQVCGQLQIWQDSVTSNAQVYYMWFCSMRSTVCLTKQMYRPIHVRALNHPTASPPSTSVGLRVCPTSMRYYTELAWQVIQITGARVVCKVLVVLAKPVGCPVVSLQPNNFTPKLVS
jgi:hypothetical protein